MNKLDGKIKPFFPYYCFFCTFRKNFNRYELFQGEKQKVLVQGFDI